MGEGQNAPHPLPVFPLQLLQTYELALKTFWLLLLTVLLPWCKISSPYLVPVPKLLNLNQDHPSKRRFFWSNPYEIEVMITSLIEMLKFPNFSHMNISTI